MQNNLKHSSQGSLFKDERQSRYQESEADLSRNLQKRELLAFPRSTDNSQISYHTTTLDNNVRSCLDEIDLIDKEIETFSYERKDSRSRAQLLDWLVGKEL